LNRELPPEPEAYLKKAAHALEVAYRLLDDGYPEDAASKTYYSMYYAAQALLKANDIHVIRHSAVESALGYHFAKAGKLDPKWHQMLIRARRIRETTDYDIQESVEPDPGLSPAEGELFLTEIKRIICSSV